MKFLLRYMFKMLTYILWMMAMQVEYHIISAHSRGHEPTLISEPFGHGFVIVAAEL